METIRDELEAFLKRWQAIEVRLRRGAAEIPPEVFAAGKAAIKDRGGSKPGDVELAAAHAPALREWVKKEFGPWGEAWAARLDDRELWRRLNDAPARWFADADEMLRRMAGETAERLFLDEFAPMARRAVELLGAEAVAALADPPEPTATVEPARLARELCGVETNDTREAGRRVLAWAAMAATPAAFHRPAGFARLVGRWARSLVVPLAEGDGYRLLGQPLVWARDAFEAAASRAADAGREPAAAPADGGEMLSHVELGRRFGVPAEALRRRLVRWRKKNLFSDGWREIDARGKHEPRFLYRLDAVRSIIERLERK